MAGGTFRTKSCLEHMDPATSSALSASDALRRAEETAASLRSVGLGVFHAPAFFSMEILLLHHFTSKVKKGLEKQLVKTWLVLCFFPHFPLHHPVGARESNPDPDWHPDELRSSGGLRLWQLYRARLQIRLGATWPKRWFPNYPGGRRVFLVGTGHHLHHLPGAN